MLGRVINDLTSNSPHVPYRDSVLTRILQPALGGNAKTAIICTVTQVSQEFRLNSPKHTDSLVRSCCLKYSFLEGHTV